MNRFNAEQETDIHVKLNEVQEKREIILKGQELIYNDLYEELEDLKNHFSLGKKTGANYLE